MLLACIHSYLKLVLRYKFLILGTHRPETLYLRQQGCGDLRLFFEYKRGCTSKEVWETLF